MFHSVVLEASRCLFPSFFDMTHIQRQSNYRQALWLMYLSSYVVDLRLIYVEIHFKNSQDGDRYETPDAILKIPLHRVCHVISVKSNNNLAF